jgi:hypothetical protein
MVSRNTAAAIHPGLAALLFVTLATLAFASNSITSVPLRVPLRQQERETTARKFVGQALRTWQERLNLRDWDIHVQLVRPSALEPKTLGNIHWDTNTRQATIDVLSSYDYTLPTPEMLNDMEFTVVHELVHLHLASLPRTEASRRNEEYVVNQFARALLNLSKR